MDAEIRTLERQALTGDPTARAHWFEAARRAEIEPQVCRLERRAYDHATVAMANLEDLVADRASVSFKHGIGRPGVIEATVSFSEDDCMSTLARCVRRTLGGALLAWDVVGFRLRRPMAPGVVTAAARHEDKVVMAVRATDLGRLLPAIRDDAIIPLLRATRETPAKVFGIDLHNDHFTDHQTPPTRLFQTAALAVADWAGMTQTQSVSYDRLDGRYPFSAAPEAVASRWAALWGA